MKNRKRRSAEKNLAIEKIMHMADRAQRGDPKAVAWFAKQGFKCPPPDRGLTYQTPDPWKE